MSNWFLSIDLGGSHEKRQMEVGSTDQLENELRTIIVSGEGSAVLSQTEIGGNDKSDFLLVGVSGCAAFAHFNPVDPPHTRPDRLRPYLWAVREGEQSVTQEPLDFDVGGTGTTVPYHRCITTERMLQIAKDYFESNKLPESIAWEEDDA